MFRYFRGLFNKGLKILLVVSVFTLVLNIFGRAITNNQPARSFFRNIEAMKKYEESIYNDPKLTSNKRAAVIVKMYRAVSCSIIGTGCTDAENGFMQSWLGMATYAGLYPLANPPASGAIETYATLARAGIVPDAYAAEGVGFGALSGFRHIWLIFRDLAFSVLVLVMVAIAFMMMFRFKINAQTAISIESSLPKIAITLILISFSYAIAGFLIDFMYIVIGLTLSILCGGVNAQCPPNTTFDAYAGAGAGRLLTDFFPYRMQTNADNELLKTLMTWIWGSNVPNGLITLYNLSDNIFNILPWPITGTIYLISIPASAAIVNYIVAMASNTGMTSIFSGLQAFTFGFGRLTESMIGVPVAVSGWYLAMQFLPRLIMMVIIFMTVVALFCRVYFMLLSTYIKILILIIFAPLYILLEAIPGQNAFSSWFRSLFGELMTFPIVIGLFVSSALIVNNYIGPVGSTDVNWAPPFLGEIDSQTFVMIIGMGLVFMIPDLTAQAKGFIGVKESGSKMGLGMFFTGGAATVAGISGAIGGGLGILKILPGNLGTQAVDAMKGRLSAPAKFLGLPLRPRHDVLTREKVAALQDKHQGQGARGNRAMEIERKKLELETLKEKHGQTLGYDENYKGKWFGDRRFVSDALDIEQQNRDDISKAAEAAQEKLARAEEMKKNVQDAVSDLLNKPKPPEEQNDGSGV